MIAASSCNAEADCFCTKLESKWQISTLGEAKHILGIMLHCDKINCIITLHQTVLLNKLISTFSQADANPVSTPIAHRALLIQPGPNNAVNDEEALCLQSLPYHSLVGLLMYIAEGTCPDIMFTMTKLSCFLDYYCKEHWKAAIWVLHYLKGTCDLHLILGGRD